MSVGALLLAGGRGTRAWPLDKLLHRDRHGRSVFERSLAVAREAVAGAGGDGDAEDGDAEEGGAVAVVLGHEAGRLRPLCAGTTVLVAVDHAEGMAASLRRGIRHAREAGWEAALVFLADMPSVRADSARAVVATWRAARGGADAVAAEHGGERGHPVLWDRRMFGRLEASRGDAGGRELLRDPVVRVRRCPVADPGVLSDLDDAAALAGFAAGDREGGSGGD